MEPSVALRHHLSALASEGSPTRLQGKSWGAEDVAFCGDDCIIRDRSDEGFSLSFRGGGGGAVFAQTALPAWDRHRCVLLRRLYKLNRVGGCFIFKRPRLSFNLPCHLPSLSPVSLARSHKQ